jgi:Flp pilus assembly protein CpaB
MPKIERKRPRRLNRRNHLSYALTGACAIGLFAAAFIAAKPSPGQTQPAGEVVRIVNDEDFVLVQTPARQVARGERLGNVPLTSLKWPKSRLTSEYISDLSAYQNAVAITPLPKLLPIPISAVTNDALDNNQVASAIPPGMRAITVKVDAESSVEGWAQSGNFVDVILVRPGKDGQGGLETKVIAENIKILSAGRSAEPVPAEQMAPKTPSTITLLASQEDTLKIKTAASLGRLTFAMRGPDDRSPTIFTDTDERRVLDDGKPIVARKIRHRGAATGPDGAKWIYTEEDGWLQKETAPQKEPRSTAESSSHKKDKAEKSDAEPAHSPEAAGPAA